MESMSEGKAAGQPAEREGRTKVQGKRGQEGGSEGAVLGAAGSFWARTRFLYHMIVSAQVPSHPRGLP